MDIPSGVIKISQFLQNFAPFIYCAFIPRPPLSGFDLNLIHKFLHVEVIYLDYIFYAYINDRYKTNNYNHHNSQLLVSHTLDIALPSAL